MLVRTRTHQLSALLLPIAAALAVCSCPPARAADGFWKKSFQPQQYFYKVNEDVVRFNRLSVDAERTPTDQNLTNYVQAGITLSDTGCEVWIYTLGYSERDAGFFKDILNIVGNLILGVSGINGASSNSLARGALGLSAGNAGIDAFREEVVLGAISDIEEKLREGRIISSANLVAHIPKNYDEAKRRLMDYHHTCSPGAVKMLLKRSLSAVKYVSPDTTLASPIEQAKADILIDKLSAEMYPAGDAKPLGGDTLYELYVTEIAMPTSKAEFVARIRDNAYLNVVKVDFESDVPPGKKATKITLLKQIADFRGYPDRLKLAAQKDAEDAAAAAVAAKAKGAADAAADKIAAATNEDASKQKRDAAEAEKSAKEKEAADKKAAAQSATGDAAQKAKAEQAAAEAAAKKAAAEAVEAGKQLMQAESRAATASQVAQSKSAELEVAKSRETVVRATAAAPASGAPAPVSLNAILVPIAK